MPVVVIFKFIVLNIQVHIHFAYLLLLMPALCVLICILNAN